MVLPTVLILSMSHSLRLDGTISCQTHHSTHTPTDEIACQGVLHCLADYLFEGGYFHIKVKYEVGREDFKGIAVEGEGSSGGIELVVDIQPE